MSTAEPSTPHLVVATRPSRDRPTAVAASLSKTRRSQERLDAQPTDDSLEAPGSHLSTQPATSIGTGPELDASWELELGGTDQVLRRDFGWAIQKA